MLLKSTSRVLRRSKMPNEITALLGNIVAQIPLVALVSYLWFRDRQDKIKQISYLRNENIKQDAIMQKFVESMDKLAISLELIKDRLR